MSCGACSVLSGRRERQRPRFGRRPARPQSASAPLLNRAGRPRWRTLQLSRLRGAGADGRAARAMHHSGSADDFREVRLPSRRAARAAASARRVADACTASPRCRAGRSLGRWGWCPLLGAQPAALPACWQSRLGSSSAAATAGRWSCSLPRRATAPLTPPRRLWARCASSAARALCAPGCASTPQARPPRCTWTSTALRSDAACRCATCASSSRASLPGTYTLFCAFSRDPLPRPDPHRGLTRFTATQLLHGAAVPRAHDGDQP